MVPRRTSVPSRLGTAPIVHHGPGYYRMIERMGAEKYEELRQDSLRKQLEARAKWGDQPVNPRDREAYKDYPVAKHVTVKPKSKRRKK